MKRIYNFSAGPATLPVEVLAQAATGIQEFQNRGMGVIEMSHRTPEIEGLTSESISLIRTLADIPDDYEILFLQGGASLQFAMVPMNLLQPGEIADYVTTGVWSEKALHEAMLLHPAVREVFSGKDSQFAELPDLEKITTHSGAKYLHITSNNTIYGTQFPDYPKSLPLPIVADMSSDIFCRPLNIHSFQLIYAGAQKNLGPSGLTLVILHKELLRKKRTDLPTMLRYDVHAANQSMYNTPPVFGIFILNLVLKWLQDRGGLQGMELINKEKAKLIYDAIDGSGFYIGHAAKKSRSLMNVTWNLRDKKLEREFLEGAKERDLDGLKGHRLVGGFRASLYNAMPIEGCRELNSYLMDFEKRYG